MIRRWVLLFALIGVAGCKVWLHVEKPQCVADSECVAMFGAGYECKAGGVCAAPPDAGGDTKPQLPVRWACVNDEPTEFIEDPDRTVKIRMDAVDLTTLRVPADLTVKACRPSDVECSAPIVEDIRPGTDGYVELNLPYGFEGFMIFEAPGFVPGLLFNNKPLIESLTLSGPVLVAEASLEDLTSHAGTEIGPGTGIIIAAMYDCLGNAGDGVMFEPIADQTPFYFDGSLPARGLTATTLSKLLGAGRETRAVGGFSNVPSGYATVQARLESNDVAVGRITVQVRAAYITYIGFYARS